MIDAMNTFRDIITSLGLPAVSRGTGVGENTVQGWRFRNSVPPMYWAGLIQAAHEAGEALTTDDLLRIAAARPPRRRANANAPGPEAA